MDPSQDPSYERLLKTEWCAKLFKDKAWRVALNKASSLPPKFNQFMGKTLSTENTIRATICLFRIHERQIAETLVLYELGNGLAGLPGVSHGGFIASMLDEASGVFVAALVGPDAPVLLEAWDNDTCVGLTVDSTTATLYLNITYLKFVKVDAVMAVRSRLKEQRGRKIWVESQIEDESGTVLAKSEALFIVRRLPVL